MTHTHLFKKLAALFVFFAGGVLAYPAFADVPFLKDIGLQTGVTPSKNGVEGVMGLDAFHNTLLMPIITGIVIFVLALLVIVMVRFNARANPTPSKTTHNVLLEVIWTVVPVLILVVIAIPSMKLLYFIDKTKEAEMTIKATGYQWYWGYEFPDHGGFEYKSNLVRDENMKPAGNPRLLQTDAPLVLPVNTNIRVLTTAADVIHAWAVPAFGVKIDAVPGRTNETWVRVEKEGTFYGQCSELCGKDHGYMPIEVKVVSKEDFATWVHTQGGKMPEETAAPAAETPVTQ